MSKFPKIHKIHLLLFDAALSGRFHNSSATFCEWVGVEWHQSGIKRHCALQIWEHFGSRALSVRLWR